MQNQPPFVSVVVPVYMVEKYLETCLESIICQKEIEIEVICIEDCSCDRSKTILQKYAEKDRRIQVIYNDKNVGLSAARNKGIDAAKGKYIWFVDSDDSIIKGSLEQLYYFAENDNVDMLSFGMECIYETDELKKLYQAETERLSRYQKRYEGIHSGQAMMAQVIKNMEFNNGCVPRYFFKREFLVREKLKFKENLLFEDNLFMSICYMKAKRVKCINKSFYCRLKRLGSITTSETEITRAKSLFTCYVELWKAVLNSELEEEGKFAFGETLYNWGTTIRNIVKKNKIEYEGINFLEKYIWKLICDDTTKPLIKNSIEIFLLNRKNLKIYIYGAGSYAYDVLHEFDSLDILVDGILVTKRDKNKKSILGHPIKEFGELECKYEEAAILIAVAGETGKKIEKDLQEKGIKQVFLIK